MVFNLLLIVLIIVCKQEKVSEVEEQYYFVELQWLVVVILEVIVCILCFIDCYSEMLCSGECFVVIGYGVLVGVVKEFEIKFIEMVCVFFSGFELEVYMYGFYLEVNVCYVMLFIEDMLDV